MLFEGSGGLFKSSVVNIQNNQLAEKHGQNKISHTKS